MGAPRPVASRANFGVAHSPAGESLPDFYSVDKNFFSKSENIFAAPPFLFDLFLGKMLILQPLLPDRFDAAVLCPLADLVLPLSGSYAKMQIHAPEGTEQRERRILLYGCPYV